MDQDPRPALPRPGRPRGALTRTLRSVSRLGRHHFQYLRGVVDGLPQADLWDRYMAFTGAAWDARRARARLIRLVEQVRTEAIGHGMLERSRLGLHPSRLGLEGDDGRSGEPASGATSAGAALPAPIPVPTALPSLTEWVSQQIEEAGGRGEDLQWDFYSEREWLGLYEEHFALNAEVAAVPQGATSLALMDVDEAASVGRSNAAPSAASQIEALREIEQRLVNQVAMSQTVDLWLEPGVARRLKKVGVLTVLDLSTYVVSYGFRWYRRVRGIGPVLAGRITDWLKGVAEEAGTALPSRATVPATVLAIQRRTTLAGLDPGVGVFSIVPLSRLAVPPALNGSRGSFRVGGPNTFGVDTDLDAINAWLARYQRSPRTFVSYGLAVERFYLWALHERRKALSDLTEADFHAYREFLAAPPPTWVSQGSVRRDSEHWRPFRGPLSPSSQRHSFAVIGALFRGLTDAGYLTANAVRGVMPFLKLQRPRLDVRRSFTEAQWEHVIRTLEQRPDTPHNRRLRLVLELGATTGLRLAEIATARHRDLRLEHIDRNDVYLLEVVGKGNRQRKVLVFDDIKAMIDAHHEDMVALGMGRDARVDELRTLDPNLQVPPAFDPGFAPIVGALRQAPPKWVEGENSRPTLDRDGPTQADAYGALDASALYQSLKRLLRDAASKAETNTRLGPDDQAALNAGSTHWLRHFFANNAADDGVDVTGLRDALGHADLKTTSVYLRTEVRRVVSAMSSVRRRGPKDSTG